MPQFTVTDTRKPCRLDSLADTEGDGKIGEGIFVAVVGAAAVHIFEEYIYPGGFPDRLKDLLPRAAQFIMQ